MDAITLIKIAKLLAKLDDHELEKVATIIEWMNLEKEATIGHLFDMVTHLDHVKHLDLYDIISSSNQPSVIQFLKDFGDEMVNQLHSWKGKALGGLAGGLALSKLLNSGEFKDIDKTVPQIFLMTRGFSPRNRINITK